MTKNSCTYTNGNLVSPRLRWDPRRCRFEIFVLLPLSVQFAWTMSTSYLMDHTSVLMFCCFIPLCRLPRSKLKMYRSFSYTFLPSIVSFCASGCVAEFSIFHVSMVITNLIIPMKIGCESLHIQTNCTGSTFYVHMFEPVRICPLPTGREMVSTESPAIFYF